MTLKSARWSPALDPFAFMQPTKLLLHLMLATFRLVMTAA